MFLDGNYSDDNDSGIITVHLDQTDRQKSLYVRNIIYDAFRKVIEKELVECGLEKKVGNVPMTFNADGDFGAISHDLRTTLVPGFMIS